MTNDEVKNLPIGTHLWDIDYGCVVLSAMPKGNVFGNVVEVVKCSTGESGITWAEDLSLLSPLMVELC